MINKFILIVICVCIISCANKVSSADLYWKTQSLPESGFKIDFPCSPEKFYKSFQDESREIHVYSFDCEIKKMKFYVSSKHYMEDFDEESISKAFDAAEDGHKEFYADLSQTSRTEIDKFENGKARLYKLENKQGKILYHLFLANDERTYSVITSLLEKDEKVDFGAISKKFIDSFETIK